MECLNLLAWAELDSIHLTAILVTKFIVMKKLVTFARALADETRWRIIRLLFDEPLCVCELADILAMPQSSVSSHLQIIRQADLLDSEKCGKWIYYRLSPAKRPLLNSLAAAFDGNAETSASLRKDAVNARRRLADRDESCCPVPKDLRKLKPLAPKLPAPSKSCN